MPEVRGGVYQGAFVGVRGGVDHAAVRLLLGLDLAVGFGGEQAHGAGGGGGGHRARANDKNSQASFWWGAVYTVNERFFFLLARAGLCVWFLVWCGFVSEFFLVRLCFGCGSESRGG